MTQYGFTSEMERSPLLAVAHGPTRIVASSASSSWQGLLLEKHITLPGERLAASIDLHVISVLAGPGSRLEYREPSGRFVECVNRTGAITITPAGPVPDLRSESTLEWIHCGLDASLIRKVIAEMDSAPAFSPQFRPSMRDESIRTIAGMLMRELGTGTPSGRLYVDSLTHALATRYILLEKASASCGPARVSSLPSRLLNRIREKIQANMEADLSLESLAGEAGYSRAHFLRMFRVATGLTPHQYVLDLRLDRAQDCLKRENASIIDIALACGFSSQSHMTTVFRQRLEMTPAQFRRSARTKCVA